MRKVLAVVAILSIAPLIGGCSEYVQKGLEFLNKVVEITYAVRAEIQEACSLVGQYEASAEQAAATLGGQCSSWHKATVRTRAGIAAVCTNLEKLTDDQVGNYVVTVRNQLKGLQSVKPAGC